MLYHIAGFVWQGNVFNQFAQSPRWRKNNCQKFIVAKLLFLHETGSIQSLTVMALVIYEISACA
jgi:hypothetical protein